MKKCKLHAQYVPELPPKCGCDACIAVWQAAQAERVRKVMRTKSTREKNNPR